MGNNTENVTISCIIQVRQKRTHLGYRILWAENEKIGHFLEKSCRPNYEIYTSLPKTKTKKQGCDRSLVQKKFSATEKLSNYSFKFRFLFFTQSSLFA